ncbi:hypothetical protein [Ancylobacter oerskovii]|uniref:Uncharacterized protein n=1 Tax=Ancylobacter oerskovii TaxID=459519 RepID=A0ABW4YY87_9HYPH|nr:hypothetical protein [Ancylobacter oerskovii]MBS7541727.1 hypothetical protein [Ancylobacter oerskovii]
MNARMLIVVACAYVVAASLVVAHPPEDPNGPAVPAGRLALARMPAD